LSDTDLFGPQAESYARFRPTYPARLFAWAASLVRSHQTAWDCATGSGQAAFGLADRFDRVVATDISERQIARARRHPNVDYRVAAAESSGLACGSVDLVMVAQALHWLDLDAFYREVRRVVRPRGALVVSVYGDVSAGSDVEPFLRELDRQTLATYWAPERRHVWEGYAGLPFPFEELAAPELVLEAQWTLDDLLGYLRSWSGVQTYVERRGSSPLDRLAARLAPLWGGHERRRRVTWPLRVRAGRVA
jgi:SAM-dependent methyltransferase